MNYEDWVNKGSALTIRHPDPRKNVILVPIRIITRPELCIGNQSSMVETFALIDTGATISAIDAELAQKLKLIPVSKCTVNGVHGANIVNMYAFDVSINRSMNVHVNLATEGQFKTSDFKFLLGMDILRLGELYLGQEEEDGKPVGTIFSFSIPPTGDSIDYVSRLNKAKKHKH